MGAMELVFKAILDRSDVSSGLKALQSQVKSFSDGISKNGIMGSLEAGLSKTAPGLSKMAGIFGSLAGVGAAIGAGFAVASNALSGLVSLMEKGISSFEKFEEGTMTIALFTGSMKEAHEEMEKLDALGEKLSTPDEQLAQAYITLRLISGEASASAKNLTLIADAAAAGRGSVEDLARGFALANASIESGDGLGKFGKKLARVGVISWEAKDAIESLSKAGRQAEALAIFNKEWEKFSGMAERKGNTMQGVMERLADAIEDLFRKFATPFVGPLVDAFDKLVDVLKAFEPIMTVFGTAIGFVIALFDTLAGVVLNGVEACFALTDAIEHMFGSEKAGQRLEARLDSITNRIKRMNTVWDSIKNGGNLNPDKVKKMDAGGDYGVDDTATEERAKNIAKLHKEIDDNKRKTSELNLSDEEKLMAMDKQMAETQKQRAQAEQNLAEAKERGETKIASLEEKALELQKAETDEALKRAELEKRILETKIKGAEVDRQKTDEIYKSMKDMTGKREYDSATTTGKFALNAQNRAQLEKERGDLLNQLRNTKIAPHSAEQDRQANADFNKQVANLQMQIADKDKALAENRQQAEDLRKDQQKDYQNAKSQTEEYRMGKLFDQLEKVRTSEQTSPADRKEAIQKEIQLREQLMKKSLSEAQNLEMEGDLGGAERKRLEAEKMKDATDTLRNSNEAKTGQLAQQGTMAQSAGGLAGSLLGIQYANPSDNEQTRLLGDVRTILTKTESAIVRTANAVEKPVIVSRFL